MTQTQLQNPLSEYPVVIEMPVLWGHMDAFQHVNNVIYFRYFESARIEYGDRLKLYQIMEETGIGPILAATGCRFLKPLVYPDTIRVGCRTVRLEPSVMEQEYAIHSSKNQRVMALGTGKVVAYDYHRRQKSSYPQALIERLLELEPNLSLSA